jgi:hypothetical protein
MHILLNKINFQPVEEGCRTLMLFLVDLTLDIKEREETLTLTPMI